MPDPTHPRGIEGMRPRPIRELRLKTYAKLNLYLKVFNKRQDGYHDIVSVMETINLADEMRLTATPDGVTIKCDYPGIPLDETNTVAKAYACIKSRFPELVRGVDVFIAKKIPPQSGLAGGSGNAAGMMYGLKELYNLPLDEPEMIKIAAEIGSDVPFMVRGGCGIVHGRGESVEKLPGLAGTFFLVIIPPDKVDTKEAYALLDTWRASRGYDPGQMSDILNEARSAWLSTMAGGVFEELLHNDFQQAVFQAHPLIGFAAEKLKKYNEMGFLTGSGAVVFSPMKDFNRALEIAGDLQTFYRDRVHVCEPVPMGVEING